ncbi:unnamed protein product [Alopecurus aequalis]
MADAVGSMKTAVELALKIMDAVDTVRQNRKDCAHIKRRAERVRRTLLLCEGNAELMESPAVRDAVEALGDGEGLELVAGCQEETNAVCLCCSAGKLSEQLGKVDRGISDGNSEATFAILVYHISKQTGNGAGPATPTEGGGGRPASSRPSMPKPTKPWTCTPLLWICCRRRMYLVSKDAKDDYGGDGNLLQKIVGVSLAITAAIETVRRNKDECIEIDKLASRASVLLSQLEDTEATKRSTVWRALESLLGTFLYAHELVVACQRRNVVVLCSPRKLSSELRGVLTTSHHRIE